MAPILQTIKNRSTFVFIRNKGNFIRGKSIDIQLLEDENLKEKILVGYTATKRLGTAVFRNKAKRIMRELAKKVILKYGKTNAYYVLIAKNSIFNFSFTELEKELKKLIS